MVRTEPLMVSLTPTTRDLSPCYIRGLVFTKPVHGMPATPSLTKTVNTVFPLTTVNTVNTSRKPLFLKVCVVVDDC